MRSPFSFFRRHQKLMLAGLGVLAMFGFVILPVILEGLRVTPQRNIVVATSKLGNVRESTLAELMRQRGVALRFLNVVADALYQVGENPVKVNDVYQRIGPATEDSVLQRWLLARYGERLGITVDDRAVNDFIADLTQGKISGPSLERMLDRQGISVDYLFRVLREELLALRVQDFLLTNLGGFTPAQHWEYFQRLNRRVTVETVALPVEQFIERVPDPPEAELRRFFEQYRLRVPHPDDPEPGFMEPKRVALEWTKASLDRFVEQAKEKVTEEEIAAYYNENKDRLYVREPLPSLPGASGGTKEESSEAVGTQGSESPGTATPSTEPQASQNQEGESNLPEPAPTDKSPAKEGTEDSPVSSPAEETMDKGSVQSPNEASAEVKPGSGENVSPGNGPQTTIDSAQGPPSGESSSATQPARGQMSGNSEPQGSAVGQKADGSTEGLEEPGDGDGSEGDADEKPGPPSDTETSSNQGATPSPMASEAGGEVQPPVSAEGASPQPSTSETSAPKEYIPLEKVREEIRTTLARQKAAREIEEILKRLEAQLGRYRDEKILYDLEVKQRRTTRRPEPQRPDLRALAKENGLEYHQTGLLADFELQTTEIAEATTQGGVSVPELVFRRLPLFRPAVVRDLRGNQYLLWKVEEKEARVPDFSDPGMREKVLREWKVIQARQIARSEAEKLAAQARQAGKSLAEVFADRPELRVELSDPFSWLTTPLPLIFWYQEPPRISQVKGVDRPGEEFMRTVFRLKPGEIGVAMNHPQRVVYVIRLVESQPSEDILWQQFITDQVRLYLVAARYDTASTLARLMEHVRRECGFQLTPEWQRRRAEQPYHYD